MRSAALGAWLALAAGALYPSADQCVNTVTFDATYSFSWTPPDPVDDTLRLTFRFASPIGWWGFGIRNSTGMVGTDAWLMNANASLASPFTLRDTRIVAKLVSKILNDARNDLRLVAASTAPNGTLMTVERAVVTGDLDDEPFVVGGPTPLSLAYGNTSTTFGYHRTNRAVASADFFAFQNPACRRVMVSQTLAGGLVTLAWSPIAAGDETIILRFTLAAGGNRSVWLGFGLRANASVGMPDMDVWWMSYNANRTLANGTVVVGTGGSVADMAATKRGKPIADVQGDVKLLAVYQNDTSTTWVVKRALATNDTVADRPFNTTGGTHIAVAWCTSGSALAYHGTNKTMATIDFTALCIPAARTYTFSGAGGAVVPVTVTWVPPTLAVDTVVTLRFDYAAPSGWFAFGIRANASSGMPDMDVIAFTVVNGAVVVTDMYAGRRALPAVDPQQNVRIIAQSITNTSISVTVQRNITSSESGRDFSFNTTGATPVAVAWGTSANVSYHRTNKTTAAIDFFASECVIDTTGGWAQNTTTNGTAGGGGPAGGAGNITTNGTTNGTDTGAGTTGTTDASAARGYRNVTVSSVVSLAWIPPTANQTHVNITFYFRGAAGWIGMGIRTGAGMVGSDTWMIRFPPSLGAVEVRDAEATDWALPDPDTSNDITLVSAERSPTLSIVMVQRALTTGDAQDQAIRRNGATPLAFAWGVSADGQFAYHGTNRIVGQLDFTALPAGGTNATAGGAATETLDFGNGDGSDIDLAGDWAFMKKYSFHALVMGMVWLFIIPATVFAVRLWPHNAAINTFHRAASTTALTLTLPAAGQAMFASSSSVGDPPFRTALHRYLGIALSIQMVIQASLGLLTNFWLRGIRRPPRMWRWVRAAHRWSGYTQLAFAHGNVLLGVRLLIGWQLFWAGLAFVVMLIILLFSAAKVIETMRYTHVRITGMNEFGVASTGFVWSTRTASGSGTDSKVRNALRSNSATRARAGGGFTERDLQVLRASVARSAMAMTMVDIRAGLQAGRKLMLWRGLVIDVGNFTHPGGSFLIERNLGEDITSWIAGMESNDESTPSHVHSAFAVHLLLGMVIGAVRTDGNESFWGTDKPKGGKSWAVPGLSGRSIGKSNSWRIGGARATAAQQVAVAGALQRSGTFRAAGPMQLAGDSEANSTAGVQAFSAWTVEKRTVVSMSSGGPVVRLELSHPYLSSQGRSVAAADWSLTGCGKYVMVRVPLRALDKYLRAREKADAHKKQQAHAVATAALTTTTTLDMAALSPSAYVLTPGGFRSTSPGKVATGATSPGGFASPATSAASSPPTSPSPLGGTRFFALSTSATPAAAEATFKGPRLPTFASRSRFAVTSNRTARGSGSTFGIGSPGALSPHTSPPLMLAPRSHDDSHSILALSPATVGRSDLDPCSPTSPLSATTNEAALSSVRSTTGGALARLGFSKRFGLGSFRTQNRVAPAPVTSGGSTVEAFPKAAPPDRIIVAAAAAPPSTAGPAAQPPAAPASDATRALLSVTSAAVLRPLLSLSMPGDDHAQPSRTSGVRPPISPGGNLAQPRRASGTLPPISPGGNLAQPRRASGTLPPISPVVQATGGSVQSFTGGSVQSFAGAAAGSYGIDVSADSPASIVAASRVLTGAVHSGAATGSTVASLPAPTLVDESTTSAAGHDATAPLPGQVLPSSRPLSHTTTTSATNTTTPSSPRGGAPPLTLSTHAGSGSSAAGTTPVFALSSPGGSLGGAVAARMAASRLLGSLSPKSPSTHGSSAAASGTRQDAAPALPTATNRRSRLKVKGTVMIDEQGNAVKPRSTRSLASVSRRRTSGSGASKRGVSSEGPTTSSSHKDSRASDAPSSSSEHGAAAAAAGTVASAPTSDDEAAPRVRVPADEYELHMTAEDDDGIDDESLGNYAVDRPYTIVRRSGTGRLVLYVKRYAQGNVSRYLCDAPVGSNLNLKGPLGLGMRLDADTGHNSVIVVIAQGTGINCAFDLLQIVWGRYERKWNHQRRVAQRELKAAKAAKAAGKRSKRRVNAFGDGDMPHVPPPLPAFPGWKGDFPAAAAAGGGAAAGLVASALYGSPGPMSAGAASGDGRSPDDAIGMHGSGTSHGGRTTTGARSDRDGQSDSMASAGAGTDSAGHTGQGSDTQTSTHDASGTRDSDSDDDDDLADAAAALQPSLRAVVLACFESEASIIEREALAWFHANCPDIRIIFNVARTASGAAIKGAPVALEADAEDGGPALVAGRLNAAKLVDILPRSDLTTVCCCGSPSFVDDVRDIYLRLGLPRPLFTIVA